MKLFDSHCHLQSHQFDADREEILSRMREAHMGAVVIGTDIETSTAALELAKKHDFLWAAVGLHPNDNKDEAFDSAAYERLARDPKVVGIGECGLDYYHSEPSDEEKAKQKKRFELQIELALTVNKALIVHCREAHEHTLAILGDYMGNHKELKVIIHFCTVSGELAQKYIDLGCYLSFPGPVTYADMYDDSIRLVPLDKILIETDAPYAAPVPYRGKKNEPSYVLEVAKKISIIKGVSAEELSAQITLNSQRVFGLH